MRLHQPPRPSAGPVRAVELQDPAQPVIVAGRVQHRAVLGDRGLSQGRPDLEDPADVVRDVLELQRRRDRILSNTGQRHALPVEPFTELRHAVRVREPGDLPRLLLELLPAPRVILHDLADHRDVQPHSAVVHPLIERPQGLLLRRGLVDRETFQYLLLRHYVLAVVTEVELPLLRIMLREVPRPSAVRLRRPAWLREVLDQRLALLVLELVLRQPHSGAYGRQGAGESHREGFHHRAAPLLRRHGLAQPSGETGPLEICIESCLDHVRISEGLEEPCEENVLRVPRDADQLAAVRVLRHAVDHLDEVAVVELVADDKDFEVGGLRIGVYPRLQQVD